MHIDREVLRANGNKTADLDKNLKGQVKVVVQRLKLKRKCTWTQTVKKLPEKLLKDFGAAEQVKEEPELQLKKEAAKNEGLGRVGRKRAPCTSLPQHDFVQPLFKKVKQEASPRELVVRTGMLSARLRERFGHLCTDM